MNKYLKLAKRENLCQKRKFMARVWKVFSGKKVFFGKLTHKKTFQKTRFLQVFCGKKRFFFKMASFYDKIVLKYLFIGKF